MLKLLILGGSEDRVVSVLKLRQWADTTTTVLIKTITLLDNTTLTPPSLEPGLTAVTNLISR